MNHRDAHKRNEDMFATQSSLSVEYIDLKYSKYTKEDCKKIMIKAIEVMKDCKKSKEYVYTNGPKVHGVREQIQLDMLDIWETRACQIYDNVLDMMNKAL